MRTSPPTARLAVAAAMLAAAALAPTAASAATTTLASQPDATLLDAGPAFADGDALHAATSASGRYVAFVSAAGNLVDGDDNGRRDVFRRDVLTGATTLVSVATNGAPIPAEPETFSAQPAISANGRYIAFQTAASLAPADVDTTDDVYLRDVVTGTTTLISASTALGGEGGAFRPAISADGNRVAFASNIENLVSGDDNGVYDAFVRDVAAATTTRVSVSTAGAQANGNSEHVSISADGQHVAFQSTATNLVADDTNGVADIFVRDLDTPLTERVSVSSAGAQGGAQSAAESAGPLAQISGDGDRVVFKSQATNLVDGDTNSRIDVFLRDRSAATTERLSVSSAGTQATNISSAPAISADGSRAVFASLATNLVDGDANGRGDIFERDIAAATTTLVSRADDGTQGDQVSELPQIAPNGRYVVYETRATNLVAGVTTAARQVLRVDRGRATPVEVDVELLAGTISWGVKTSFRNYISGPIAHGDITLSDGAKDNGDGSFAFPIDSGAYDSDSGFAEIEARGTVRFRGHETPRGSGNHLLLLTVSNPRVTIDGDYSVLHADMSSKSLDSGEVVEYPDVALAALDSSGVTPATAGGETAWSAVPSALTAYGAPAFATFYTPGTALDPVTIRALDHVPVDPPVDPPTDPPTDPPAGPPSGPPADRPTKPKPVSPKPPLVTGARTRQVVGKAGVAKVAGLVCRADRCRVAVAKRVRVTIGDKAFTAKVLAPKALKAGARGSVRVKLPKAALARLAGRRAKLALRITLASADRKTTKKVAISIVRPPAS